MTIAEMSVKTADRVERFRFSVGQYHRMIADGILREGEPLELLNGQIERKDRSTTGQSPKTVSTQHATAVARINDLNPRFKRLGCHIRIQQPLTIRPFDEPEPDAAIVSGKIGDYADQHPGPRNVFCVIEVADSSLGLDRSRKLRIYSNSRIPQYVIVNLADRLLEVYTHPKPGKGRYDHVEKLSLKQSIAFLTAGKPLSVAVRRILP